MSEPTTPTRPPVYDRVRSKKKPIRRHVDLCLDSDVADAHTEAVARVRDAEQTIERKTKAKAAAGELADARQLLADAEADAETAHTAMVEASERFTFRSIGRKAFAALVEDHPPTPEQIEKAKRAGEERPEMNDETFIPACIAACSDDGLTVEQVTTWWNSDDWSTAELMTLFYSANAVNSLTKVVDLGKGSGSTSG